MTSSRCDRRRLALALIAIVTNSCYTTIAPILPLEIDKHRISERWSSLLFLAFSVGSAVSPLLVARHLESVGAVRVMAYSMVGMSIMFWCIGHVLDIAAMLSSSGDQDQENNNSRNQILVGLLALLQFFLGAFFSAITTGYYSLATLVFVEKESAMSSIEASVGCGYILGPILGSWIYDELGYEYTFTFISLGLLMIAFVTWKFLAPYLNAPDVLDEGIETDLEAQTSFLSYNSLDESERNNHPLNIETQEEIDATQQPSTVKLLRHPKIFIGAMQILWINVSWTFIEPLLAKRLDHFNVGKKEIGLVFSLSNIVYVPTVFLVQYLPWRHNTTGRQRIISISAMLTPISVLLVGNNSFPVVVLGVSLIGLLPTPVWVQLLPWMLSESLVLFPDPRIKRSVNDYTCSIYNSFMTLGGVVGYFLGMILSYHGFTRATRIVALLIFLQSMLFYFGTGNGCKHRGRESANHKQLI